MPKAPRNWPRQVIRGFASGLALWCGAALWSDSPSRVMGAGLAAVLALVAFNQWRPRFRRRWEPLAFCLLSELGVMVWWFHLEPSNAAAWAPEFSQLSWATIEGSTCTVHNVRNFHYRGEHDFDPRWETRIFNLDEIEGADLFLTHWGLPLVAHSMVSFRFANGKYLATSIEARRRPNQEFSAWRGFFRQFPVMFIVADEIDVVGVRANFRKEENVYLYRTRLAPADARMLFRDFVARMNALRAKPQWYNALTNNCGSAMVTDLARAHIGRVTHWDWRTVFAGEADRMLYDLGDLNTSGLSFGSLKDQALVNPAAHRASTDPSFSSQIRKGKAGFEP